MATQKLIIDNDGQGRFLLRVDGNGVTVTGPDGERALESLKVLRIHCVIDVETDGVTVRGDGDAEPQKLEAGDVIEGDSRIRLQGATGGQSGIIRGGLRLKKRLLAIAGPDEGQEYPLPDSGIVVLGKDRAHVDICLRGLRVDRVHCHLRVEGNIVEVVDQGKLGTLVNGKRVNRHELKPGDVIKIDNNQLQFEAVGPNEEFSAPAPRRTIQDEVAEAEAELDQEELTPPPDDAPEQVKLLYEWRVKLPELAGQDLGHYQLGPVLQRGRYGVVLRATDRNSGQTLVLKVLSPQFPADNAELQRFASVIKALLPLRHDHVVTLFAAGKNAPFTWLAREFVDGESVSRVLRRQERDEEHDVELAARVALHVTRALVFGRENRLKHGAIAPSSILIRKNDQVVKLSGFMQEAALEGSVLAEAVKGLRTPAEAAYLSPEQATPGAFIDETSDMYALGAVVYVMLTGRPPFTGKTTEEVLGQIRGGGRAERPAKINREVPASFETVVIKLLEKQPEYRYSTPSQLLSDLEPVAAELGVED